jgi:hypothetical protein
MNTATTNPPIRIRRITAPAIEASKDPRPSPLATSPPKPASQAKDLGDPTRRYCKKIVRIVRIVRTRENRGKSCERSCEVPARSDAVFCSGRCRVAHHRGKTCSV